MRERIAVSDDLRFDHFAKQVITFTSSLANAGEYRESLAAFRNVVDQFHDQNRLSHARTAKESDLSAAEKRLNKIDDLNAGLEHLKRCRLFVKCRCMPVDRVTRFRNQRAKFVHRVADHVHYSSQSCATNRDGYSTAEVDNLHSADHAVGRQHGDRANAALAEMLLHFRNDIDRRFNLETF